MSTNEPPAMGEPTPPPENPATVPPPDQSMAVSYTHLTLPTNREV